jgi:flagellar motor switch protein FliM
MKEILTNDEIDALLDLFQNEGMPDELEVPEDLSSASGAFRTGGEVSPLDLLKPNRFTREQLLAISRIQEMVARKLGGTVSDRLRLEANCDCVGVEQLRFSTWLSLLDNPIGVYLLESDQTEQPMVMTISADLLYGAVDRILGGSGVVSTLPKDLSEAEHTVSDAVVIPIMDQLMAGLSEVFPVRARIGARYTNPAMAQVLPLQEVMLALHFQVAGNPLLGDIRLALPYSILEPHLESLSKSRYLTVARRTGEFRETLSKTLQQANVHVSIELGVADITLEDLMALSVGDVITLPTRPGDEVVVPVQGRGKFKGQLGVKGGRFGARILSVLDDGGAA